MIFPKSKLILAFIMASAAALLGACGGADAPATPVPPAAAEAANTPVPPPTTVMAVSAPASPVPAATASAPVPPPTAVMAANTPVPPTPFPPAPTVVAKRPEVVTTTAFVADWVANVGGDRVDVTSLVPRSVDPHSFQPGARDIVRVAEADLIFGVGLTLEDGWLIDLIQNASRDPDAFVPLAEGVDPIEFGAGAHDGHDDHEGDEHDEDHEDEHDEDHEGHDHDEDEHDEDHDEDEHDEDHEDEHDEDHEGHDHDEDEHDEDHDEDEHDEDHEDEHDEDHEGHDHNEDHEDEHEGDEHDDHEHGAFDPHFWFDPIRVGVAVDDIAARLSALDAANADFYASNAAAYNAELVELDEWVRGRVSEVPEGDRKLATSHDALGYFALRYGFEIVGAVIPGGGTEVEPSAQEIAALIERLRAENVKAVFTETTVSDKLSRQVADEAGAKIINDLYTGGMSAEDGEAGTYLAFMRYNTAAIVDALK